MSSMTPPEGQQQEPQLPFPAQHQEKPGLESQVEPRPRYQASLYQAAGKLRDKVALITGGDSGIGRAVAVLFAREGADVAIVYLPQEQSDADETRLAVEAAGRRALLLPGDITEADFSRQAVERTVQEFGKLDILVNNAAFQQQQQQIEDITDEQWDRTFKTNIYGYFRMAKAAVPHLKPGSAIINTGSSTAIDGSKQQLDYSATKGAIHTFTLSLAQQLADRGIRVNCVAPGPVWTPLNPSDAPAEEVAKFGQQTLFKRPGQPEELAPAYVFLASEADSSFVTGEILGVMGGKSSTR
jgi:NAD(P)-dependent dehydrogenase (short-subunit alcohol dehydrogenase family)